MATRIVRRSTVRYQGSSLVGDLVEMLENLANSLFDTYRPELHYMRGPGPKWHAKHERKPATFEAVPALVRVRAKG